MRVVVACLFSRKGAFFLTDVASAVLFIDGRRGYPG